LGKEITVPFLSDTPATSSFAAHFLAQLTPSVVGGAIGGAFAFLLKSLYDRYLQKKDRRGQSAAEDLQALIGPAAAIGAACRAGDHKRVHLTAEGYLEKHRAILLDPDAVTVMSPLTDELETAARELGTALRTRTVTTMRSSMDSEAKQLERWEKQQEESAHIVALTSTIERLAAALELHLRSRYEKVH
jgi:hypothetical protein